LQIEPVGSRPGRFDKAAIRPEHAFGNLRAFLPAHGVGRKSQHVLKHGLAVMGGGYAKLRTAALNGMWSPYGQVDQHPHRCIGRFQPHLSRHEAALLIDIPRSDFRT
jgi:hypothetical protein